jgi:hypothetical protein
MPRRSNIAANGPRSVADQVVLGARFGDVDCLPDTAPRRKACQRPKQFAPHRIRRVRRQTDSDAFGRTSRFDPLEQCAQVGLDLGQKPGIVTWR